MFGRAYVGHQEWEGAGASSGQIRTLSPRLRWPWPEQILLWHQSSLRLSVGPGDEVVIASPVPVHAGSSPSGSASLSSQNCGGGTGSQKLGLDQEIQHILAIAFLSLGCPLPDRSLVIQLWKHISCYFLALEHS